MPVSDVAGALIGGEGKRAGEIGTGCFYSLLLANCAEISHLRKLLLKNQGHTCRFNSFGCNFRFAAARLV